MPQFGDLTPGGGPQVLTDRLMGSPYTCPEIGVADSMVFRMRGYTTGACRGTLFKVSDNSLVGETVERIISTGGYNDEVFPFLAPKPTLANIPYYLMLFSDGSTALDDGWGGGGAPGRWDDLHTYNGAPNPLVPNLLSVTRYMCCACNYSLPSDNPWDSSISNKIMNLLTMDLPIPTLFKQRMGYI